MKKSLLFIVLIILLGGGVRYYLQRPSNIPETEYDGELCIQVITEARNPETGEIQAFPTPCDVPEGWDTLETDPEQFSRNDQMWSRYRNDDLGVRFEYRLEPNGYILVEQDTSKMLHDEIVEFISLFNKQEYVELLESDIPREGPPGISLVIYNNPANYSPKEWVEKESSVSNINLAISSVSEIEFAGTQAVRYTADGLYTNDIIVALNNGRIYYLAGSYVLEDSQIRKDFLEVIEHFSLY